MAQIKDLTKDQLWQLRQEIVLNSLFNKDYNNSFGIDPNECCTFFDGYVENLYELAKSDGDKYDVNVLSFTDYDSPDELYNYWCELVANEVL